MHQTRKGKQWHFGMKAHVGVDSKTKLIHRAVATAANVADATVLPQLLHGEETRVWGDQAYRGQSEVMHKVSPPANDCTNQRYRYRFAFPACLNITILRAASLTARRATSNLEST